MPPPRYHIPEPQRIRRIVGSLIDHRLLRNGYLAVMTHQEQSLYLFLVLAALRNGVSFYRQEKICDQLGMDAQAFSVARDRLVELQLSAFVQRDQSQWLLSSAAGGEPGAGLRRPNGIRAKVDRGVHGARWIIRNRDL